MRRRGRPAPGDRRLGRSAFLLALIVFVAYTYGIPRGPLANSDTRIALTRAIVDGQTLAIDRYAAGLTDRSAYHGHYYTDKTPEVSFLAVPAYAGLRALLPADFFGSTLFFMVRYLVTAVVVSLPAALFVGLLWRFLLPVLGRRRAAMLTVGYGLGTMAWATSALLFSHTLAASTLFGAFMLLYPVATGRRAATLRRWGAAGALCGTAMACEYPAGLVALLLLTFAAHAAGRQGWRRALSTGATFIAAMAVALMPVALYNRAVYGSPLSQGYAHLGGQAQFIHGMAQGVEGVGMPSLSALWGITFSPYRGLFILSPFLLLAAPGLVAMWRQREQRSSALLCLAVVAVMLLFNSAYYFWDGGVSLGPRHASPALPFLVFPVAFALRRWPWRRMGGWLIGASVAIVSLCCLTVTIFLPGVPNPIVNLALAHLLNGPTPNNWGMFFGLTGELSFLPLLVVEAALARGLWHETRAARHGVREPAPLPARRAA